MEAEEAKLCPSATCSSGATLLGIVQDDHTVQLLDVPIKLNNAFVTEAKEHGEPEKRFRFANKCVKSGCKQWTGKSCGVAEELLQLNPAIQLAEDEQLPACVIRKTCRWFSQEGGKACKICLFVVTQSSGNL